VGHYSKSILGEAVGELCWAVVGPEVAKKVAKMVAKEVVAEAGRDVCATGEAVAEPGWVSDQNLFVFD